MNRAAAAFAAIALVFASTSFALWQRLRDEREQHAAARATIRALEQQPRAEWPVQPTAPPLASATEAELEHAADTAPPKPRTPDIRAAMQRSREMLRDPEYRAAMQTQHRYSLRRTYSDVGGALQLTPAEVDQLLDVLASQRLRAMENGMNLRGEGATDPSAVKRLAEEQQRQFEAELGDVLGGKLQAWKNYQSSMGARMQVRELRASLVETEQPLRIDRAEALVAALAQEDRRLQQELQAERESDPAAVTRRHFETQLRYQERRREAAASHLSGAQLQAFYDLVDQQIATLKAQQRVTETQALAEPAAAAIAPSGTMRSTAGTFATRE